MMFIFSITQTGMKRLKFQIKTSSIRNHLSSEAFLLSDLGNGVMMSSAERYRSYAAECIRLAQHSTNPADRALLVEMAENWIRRAERAEARADTNDAEKDEQ